MEGCGMRLILAILDKALRQSIVVLGLILFISLSGVFFFVQQPNQLSAISYQLSAISYQLSAISYQLSAF
jgi:hypothetical protein